MSCKVQVSGLGFGGWGLGFGFKICGFRCFTSMLQTWPPGCYLGLVGCKGIESLNVIFPYSIL